MPYIKKEKRSKIDDAMNRVIAECIDEGDFNYAITRLLLSRHPRRYADFNAIVGILECCKLEFYRRAVATYEDEKIDQNGDVYWA